VSQGHANLNRAIADRLRADTGAGSLATLTQHDAADPNEYRIGRDKPMKGAKTPYLGISVFQSIPLIDNGPSETQLARIHFRSYSRDALTSMQIADRLEHLLHSRGSNTSYLDFSDERITTQQVQFKRREDEDFDDKIDAWTSLVEADVIWLDEPCT